MNDTCLIQDHKFLDRIVSGISEFLQVPADVVRQRISAEFEKPGQAVARAWRSANPRSPEEIVRFYRETDAYIYDLAADHCRPRRHAIWSVVTDRVERLGPHRRVLLYGDGIGTDSLNLAERGYRVTYFDLPGLTSRFARHRFHREGFGDLIVVLDDPGSIPDGAFDAVISIEVLEHLTDPLSAMRDYYRSLEYGGVALITESFGSVGDDYPSHLETNLHLYGKTHHMMETLGFASTYYNKNPVNYPMEFTKSRRGLSGVYQRSVGRIARFVDTRRRRVAARWSHNR